MRGHGTPCMPKGQGRLALPVAVDLANPYVYSRSAEYTVTRSRRVCESIGHYAQTEQARDNIQSTCKTNEANHGYGRPSLDVKSISCVQLSDGHRSEYARLRCENAN